MRWPECTAHLGSRKTLVSSGLPAQLCPIVLPPRCPVGRLDCLFKNPICDSLGTRAACFSNMPVGANCCLVTPACENAQQSCLNSRCPRGSRAGHATQVGERKALPREPDQAHGTHRSSADWGRGAAIQCPWPGREGRPLNPARSLGRNACGAVRAGTSAIPAGTAKSTPATDEVTEVQPDDPHM